MKNFIYLLLVSMIAFSCQPCEQRYAESGPEIEITKKLIEAYISQNTDYYAEVYADTANIYHNSLTPMSVTEMIAQEKEYAGMWTNIEMEDSEWEVVTSDEGKRWVSYWGIWNGTMAANGKTYRTPMHMSLRFVGDKVVEEWGYWDNSEVVIDLMAMEQAEKESSENDAIEELSEDDDINM